MATHDIVVIGASAGGVEALRILARALPKDFPGSIFIVLHTSPEWPSALPAILSKQGPLSAITPEDRSKIERGVIYIAPSDHHMLLDRDGVRIVRGPKENRHRPAIDPLFRSAAWAFGPRVVGIVLSGILDDGSAGLWAIKSCGGVTVVQDPEDADFPQMPMNAMLHLEVDHSLPVAKLAPLLTKLVREPVDDMREHEIPANLKIETEFTTMERDIGDMGKLGDLSAFTCPTCRGA